MHLMEGLEISEKLLVSFVLIVGGLIVFRVNVRFMYTHTFSSALAYAFYVYRPFGNVFWPKLNHRTTTTLQKGEIHGSICL